MKPFSQLHQGFDWMTSFSSASGVRHGGSTNLPLRRTPGYVPPLFYQLQQELMRTSRVVPLFLSVSVLLLYVLSRHQECNSDIKRNAMLRDRDMRSVVGSERIGGDPRLSNSSEGRMPSVCIFSAPKPPYGTSRNDLQRRALLSWLRLKPPARIVLLGEDPSLEDLAAEFPGRIEVESDIDYSFKGIPMFHTIIGRARAAETEISVFVNSDILLLRDFYPALQRAMVRYPEGFLLTGMRWDVNHFPFAFDTGGKIVYTDGTPAEEESVIEYVRDAGVLHTHGGVDFWAWNNAPASPSQPRGGLLLNGEREASVLSRGVRLHAATMPPFIFGRGRYDNWIIHEAITSLLRVVIDASDAITSIHVAHDHQHLVKDDADLPLSEGRLGNFWSLNKKRSWEIQANIYLSRTTGSFSSQMGTALHTPIKLARCEEPASNYLCITRRVKPATCRCEYSPFVENTQSEPRLIGSTFTCGTVIVDNDYQLEVTPQRKSIRGLPHTLLDLLPDVVDANNTVTLVVATNEYRDMVANFGCRMRMLGVFNLLIAAVDPDVYRYLFSQGFAVYYEPGPQGTKREWAQSEMEGECTLGSKCWRHVRLVKYNAMWQILAAGYNVLYSDLDQVWVEDMRPHFWATPEMELLVQSGVPIADTKANALPAVDAGAIMFAKSHWKMWPLFEKIVAEAEGEGEAKEKEHLLYSTVCGPKGERRRGSDRCDASDNVTAVFLSRNVFVEGERAEGRERGQLPKESVERIAKVVEKERPARGRDGALEELGRRLAFHHGLIPGGAKGKTQRLRELGLWRYDAKRRMCVHVWHRKLREVEDDKSEF